MGRYIVSIWPVILQKMKKTHKQQTDLERKGKSCFMHFACDIINALCFVCVSFFTLL